MNKLVHLRLSILELSKILKYKFCYDYIKPKYGVKRKLCYVDIESFIVYIIKKIFIKILQKMLKLHFILRIINQIDHWQKEKQKSNHINER